MNVKLVLFINVIFVASCSFFNPDPGLNNIINQNSGSVNSSSGNSGTNNFNYTINFSGPLSNPYYSICAINCDVLTATTNITYQLANPATNASATLGWYSSSTEMPYLYFYSVDPGGTGEREYLAIASASAQSQTITVTLQPLGESAVFTNNSSSNICVFWTYYLGDTTPFFYINGYLADGVTLCSSQETAISGSGIIIYSSGKFDIWLGLKGKKFYLSSANATAN